MLPLTSSSSRCKHAGVKVLVASERILRDPSTGSLHWHDPQEVHFTASKKAVRRDKLYSVCAFMGARCKHQRLCNIDEITMWAPAQCKHTHSPDDWRPFPP